MRAPGPILSGGGLIHPPHTSMDVLAAWRGIRLYRDLPFPGLINEPVADLQLHRQHTVRAGGRGLSRRQQRQLLASVSLGLLLGPPRHPDDPFAASVAPLPTLSPRRPSADDEQWAPELCGTGRDGRLFPRGEDLAAG